MSTSPRAARTQVSDGHRAVPGHGPTRYVVQVSATAIAESCRWHLAEGCHRIGRDDDCAIALSCPSVSRRHASVHVMADGGLVIVDLGSTNGMRVNGRVVQQTAISGDFELTIGQQRLLFREARAGG